MSLATIDQTTTNELLVIERLAAALEKCASVDEIKDVRDRAMAIQLYARKKAGGLQAAQFAGRVVTDATIRLAELYQQETPAPGKRSDLPLIDEKEVRGPGRRAIADAAGMSAPNLAVLRPLVEAPKARVAQAKVAIESRGDVVTPSALLREVTSASSQPDYDGDSSFTPERVVEMVRQVLGTIDVDPATHAVAQQTVKATRFYTKSDDGLKKEWRGNVFCNPPYSSGSDGVEGFTSKLIEEYQAGRTTAAIYLVNNSTDSHWFQSLLSLGGPVCLTRGRLPFVDNRGREFPARRGQAIFYLGPNEEAFAEAFSAIGTIVRAESSSAA